MGDINLRLYPTRSVYSVLGNICNNPRLLRHPDVQLKQEDFYQEIHQMIFSTVSNIIYEVGDKENVTPIEVDNYLSEYPTAYKKWEKYGGFEYLQKSIDFAKKDSFTLDYNRLKKFSLLRYAHSKGLDISYFYDTSEDGNIDENMKFLDENDINDMIEYYSRSVIDIRDHFSVTNKDNSYKAGEGLEETLRRLHEEPQFGLPFRNPFYNTIFRGAQRGKLMLRSADSGVGKSRNNINDMCYMGLEYIWCPKKKDFVYTGEKKPTLYLGSEEEKEEIDTIMLAVVSGVSEDVIKDGDYSDSVRQRLERAMEIIQDGSLYIHREDDFSITDIEMIIESYILEYNVQNVAFDYIQMTPKISRSMLNQYGVALREDQILRQFSLELKNIADKYNIFILSSTQLNRLSIDRNQRNANCLAGGKATTDKVDHGVQLYRVENEDLKNLQAILNTGKYEEPNYSHWVYKNRGNPYPDCIIWSKMNLGNMTEEVLFVTDRKYNLIEMEKTEIIVEGEDISTKTTPGEPTQDFVEGVSIPIPSF